MKKMLFIIAAIMFVIIGCKPSHDNNNTNCNNAITIDSIYTTNIVVDQSAMVHVSWNDNRNTSWDVIVYNPDNTVFAQRINIISRATEFPEIRVNTEYRLEIRGRQDTICPAAYRSILEIGNQGDVQKPR